MNRFSVVLFTCIILACGAQSIQNKKDASYTPSESFSDYWYSGKAELNSYDLKQARYGEIREGQAVLVFVTEDFLVEKQVKKESNTKKPAVSVLKLNLLKKFNTGIYDYSMMSSVFSPINQSKPLKISTSSQEWCGHTWLQINAREGFQEIKGYSYFESEADQNFKIKEEFSEDGLWNLIRIDPKLIEEGEFNFLPGTQYLRLKHKEIKTYKAQLTKSAYTQNDMHGEKLRLIKLSYPDLNRTLSIIYEEDFPHRIAGWKEVYPDAGQNAEPLESIAIRKRQIKEPYWNLNRQKDSTYRSKLGL